MPPKKNSLASNLQSKLKYKELCINQLLTNLPKQTFSHINPIHCPPNSGESNPTSTPIVLSQPSYSQFPNHPNINLLCIFCNTEINSMDIKHFIEHPHMRRRFTPVCSNCMLHSYVNM